MTPKLTDDLRQAIEEHGGAPLYLVDATNNRYVLLQQTSLRGSRPSSRRTTSIRVRCTHSSTK